MSNILLQRMTQTRLTGTNILSRWRNRNIRTNIAALHVGADIWSFPDGKHIDSFYSRTRALQEKQYPQLRRTEDADVVIIGGGLAGINTALSLSLRGKKVVLLEGNKVCI